ncbi:MAG: glycosyltransferase [Candidatus Dadabacteria bacterium]
MSEFIHIVSLDAPSPPDYGGAIDIFYKIKALSEAGKKIILHYFWYKKHRGTKGLEPYCTQIYAYKRKYFLNSLSFTLPHVVKTRINKLLVNRLNHDDYPILLEGVHCAGILPYINNRNRVILRIHNDEATYYGRLANSESRFVKKIYFSIESYLLQKFQQNLPKDLHLACLSETDIEAFCKQYEFRNISFIPCFLPWQTVNIKTGSGDFCLYHGNLSISENDLAARWLISEVFSKITTPLIIAGKGASGNLIRLSNRYQNIQLLNNPTVHEIDKLIQEAHINIIPSMNRTGVKLKLLHSLLQGRYCVTNIAGVEGSHISKGVHIANEPAEYKQIIQQLMMKPFDNGLIKEREDTLKLYDNHKNAMLLIEEWKHCL